MRAILIADFERDAGEVIIGGDKARHLIKVVRIKPGEKLKVLNGKGSSILCEVKTIDSKKLFLNILKVESFIREDKLDLALGLPKTDAFEDVIKSACELGLGKIIPVKMEHSQFKPTKSDRYNKLIESSLIQSNNPFFLKIDETINFIGLRDLLSSYDKILYFCSHQDIFVKNSLEIKKRDRILMIIGPEGGLSEEEESLLNAQKNVYFINLPSYILRTQTAVAICCGWVFAKMPN